MPGGNGTGPLGMGPMTGRAAGRCAGYSVPGYMGYFPGQGCRKWGGGMRWGGGRGRGFGGSSPRSYPYPNTTDEAYRISDLEKEARYLESSLENIRRQIAEAKGRREID